MRQQVPLSRWASVILTHSLGTTCKMTLDKGWEVWGDWTQCSSPRALMQPEHDVIRMILKLHTKEGKESEAALRKHPAR